MKILVFGGGDSPEHDVSLRSAKAIADGAREAGFEVLEAGPSEGLEVLDKITKDDIVMPILHGINGEDGVLQTEFEKRGLPFLGSTSEVMKVTIDKWATLQKLRENEVPVAESVLVTKDSYLNATLFRKPHVIKVNNGGSSIGTVVVRDPAIGNREQIEKAVFSLGKQAVLEELINGHEITISILDKTALPALEVIPPEGGEFDYENKYNDQSQELTPPPSLNDEQHNKAKKLGEKVHKIMGCRHLSRIDMFMRPDGSFAVLEINTIPGLTPQSLYPKSAKAGGYDMKALVSEFVELVKRDYHL